MRAPAASSMRAAAWAFFAGFCAGHRHAGSPEPALKRRRLDVPPLRLVGHIGEDAEEALTAEVDAAIVDLGDGSQGAAGVCGAALRDLRGAAEHPDSWNDDAKREPVVQLMRCLDIPNAEPVVARVLIRVAFCDVLGAKAQGFAINSVAMLWAQARHQGVEPEFFRAEEALLNSGAKRPAFALMLLAKSMVDLGADVDFLVRSLGDSAPTGPKVACRLGQIFKTVAQVNRAGGVSIGVCFATLRVSQALVAAASDAHYIVSTRLAALRELRDIYKFLGPRLRQVVEQLFHEVSDETEEPGQRLLGDDREQVRTLVKTSLGYMANLRRSSPRDVLLRRYLSGLACPRMELGLPAARATIGFLRENGAGLSERQRTRALCLLRDVSRPRLERQSRASAGEGQAGELRKALLDIGELLDLWPLGERDACATSAAPLGEVGPHVRFADDTLGCAPCADAGALEGSRRPDGG